MKLRINTLLPAFLAPLCAGGLGALCARAGLAAYSALQKPPLTPPNWAFPVVWTLLYLMMGLASALVYASDAPPESRRAALATYALSLAVNALWPLLFFTLRLHLIAFFALVLLFLLLRSAMVQFYPLNRMAACLLFPSLLWITFAGYLNLGVWLLN